MKIPPPSLPQRGPQIIAPARLGLILASLGVAILLALLPWPRDWLWLMPDFPLMVLLYWSTHEPRRTPLRLAFALGLLSDVARGLLLGLNALGYTTAAFIALLVQRRLTNFGPMGQALQLAPVFFAVQLLTLLLGLAMARGVADWRYLAGALLTGLLWLPMCLLLNRIVGRPDQPAPPPSG